MPKLVKLLCKPPKKQQQQQQKLQQKTTTTKRQKEKKEEDISACVRARLEDKFGVLKAKNT